VPLGALLFNSRVNFKVLVATIPVVKFEGFKEVVVLTLKIKNGAAVRALFD
jgi:hypothetical protein